MNIYLRNYFYIPADTDDIIQCEIICSHVDKDCLSGDQISALLDIRVNVIFLTGIFLPLKSGDDILKH